MNFTKGDRVRHPGKPEWDMGQVLEDCAGGDVKVYFVGGGEKKLRLDYVTLERVEGDAAANPVLDSLGKRQPRTAAAGAKRGKKERKTRTIEQLAADFTRLFPEGFHDPMYLRDERDGKDAKSGPKVDKAGAHELMEELLGREQLDALISAGEHTEVGRRALRVIAATSLVFPREAISLKNGLKDENNQRLFAESLRSLLYGDAEAGSRFAAFCDMLSTLGAAKWPLATYFPFVAFPEREMFLKPTVTRRVAEMLGFELNYSVEPNWLTYSKLLELSRHLFDSLSELRPRDMIDIQSFIRCVVRHDEGEYLNPPPVEGETPDAPNIDTNVADTPSGDAADAGVPPWMLAPSDAGGAAGATETPDERATSPEAATVSEATGESNEAARASTEAPDDAGAAGGGDESVAGDESGAAGEGGREGVAAAD